MEEVIGLLGLGQINVSNVGVQGIGPGTAL
jgi:hypothetical protein